MKNILYMLSISVFFVINSCTGDKGEVGPIGDTGASGINGTNGVAGSKGPTGDKGATGDAGQQGPVGEKGPSASLSVSYTDWALIGGFENSTSNVYMNSTKGSNSTDFSIIIPSEYSNSIFSSEGKFNIINNKTGTIVGFLYHYVKLLDNNEEVIFRDVYNTEKVDFRASFLLLAQSVGSTIYAGYKKGQYDSSYNFVDDFAKRKPTIRYVFIPINLGARMQSIDMNNYEEVKRIFEIKE